MNAKGVTGRSPGRSAQRGRRSRRVRTFVARRRRRGGAAHRRAERHRPSDIQPSTTTTEVVASSAAPSDSTSRGTSSPEPTTAAEATVAPLHVGAGRHLNHRVGCLFDDRARGRSARRIPDPEPAPGSEVRVVVANASGADGPAARFADELRAGGYADVVSTNAVGPARRSDRLLRGGFRDRGSAARRAPRHRGSCSPAGRGRNGRGRGVRPVGGHRGLPLAKRWPSCYRVSRFCGASTIRLLGSPCLM